jgi:hypothetical protein
MKLSHFKLLKREKCDKNDTHTEVRTRATGFKVLRASTTPYEQYVNAYTLTSIIKDAFCKGDQAIELVDK